MHKCKAGRVIKAAFQNTHHCGINFNCDDTRCMLQKHFRKCAKPGANFKNGELVDRMVGAASKADIAKKLDSLL